MNLLKKLTKSGYLKFLIPLLLLAGTFSVLLLLPHPQETKTHAAIDQTLDHVLLVYYGSNTLLTNSPPLQMSAQGVNSAGQPVDGVSYIWTISSTGSIGTLGSTNQNVNSFRPFNTGEGDIVVTALKNNISVSKSFHITVTSGAGITTTPTPITSTTPTPAVAHPVHWHTSHVSLGADDFWIIANGKKFTAENATVEVHSSSPYPPLFNTTTLEATWTESGVEMRFYMYFTLVNGQWRVDEMRTYDGSAQGRWIFYNGFQGSTLTQPMFQDLMNFQYNPSPSFPDSPYAGSIHFQNITLAAFLNQPPSTGYYLYNAYPNINMAVSAPNSSWVTTVYLFNNGQQVTNQSGLTYTWTIDDSTIASISPFADCENNSIVPPCPQGRISITGKKAGSTAIHVTVKNSSNTTLATATINLTVTGSSTNSTKFSTTTFLHGIGKGGDNANPTGIGNSSPVHPQRTLTLEIRENGTGNLLNTLTGTISFNSVNGNFTGIIDSGTSIPSGNYIIKMKAPSFLSNSYAGTVAIVDGQTNSLPPLRLTVGDANDDNSLNILDYNLMLDCYSDLAPARDCNPTKQLSTDFTDDGSVNQIDYNLLLREFSVQSGR